MVGKLNGLRSKALLLKSYALQSVNAMTVSQAFINCLYILQTFGNTLCDSLILIVTNTASYMVVAFKNLKQTLLPQLIHVTCVAHAIHRVCKIIREDNVKINRFVSLIKKVLLKSQEKKFIYNCNGSSFSSNPNYNTMGYIFAVRYFLIE